MPGELGREHIEKVLKRAADSLDAAIDGIDVTFGGIPYGAKQAKDEDIVAMYDAMLGVYPPQEWVLPDGTRFQESAWVLALQTEVDGGREFMSRYHRAMKNRPAEEMY